MRTEFAVFDLVWAKPWSECGARIFAKVTLNRIQCALTYCLFCLMNQLPRHARDSVEGRKTQPLFSVLLCNFDVCLLLDWMPSTFRTGVLSDKQLLHTTQRNHCLACWERHLVCLEQKSVSTTQMNRNKHSRTSGVGAGSGTSGVGVVSLLSAGSGTSLILTESFDDGLLHTRCDSPL
jgi:hypothetical protein